MLSSNVVSQVFIVKCYSKSLLLRIDLLQTLKVTKSGHHLSHDRASKEHGFIPCLTSQTSLHACLQRRNTMQISL